MVLCHKCLLIISNDRKHPEICVDALILRLSDFFWLPGKLKQKVVQLTPFSPTVKSMGPKPPSVISDMAAISANGIMDFQIWYTLTFPKMYNFHHLPKI